MLSAEFVLSNYADTYLINCGMSIGNSAVAFHDGFKYMVSRHTNYMLVNEGGALVPRTRPSDTFSDEFWFQWESRDNIRQISCIGCSSSEPQFPLHKYSSFCGGRGLEDPRLIEWNGKIYAIFTKCHPDDPETVNIVYAEMLSPWRGIIGNLHVAVGRQKVEKNWQPVPGHPGTCIYTAGTYGGDFKTTNLFNGVYSTYPGNDIGAFPLNGSTNLLCWGGKPSSRNMIGIMHSRDEEHHYLHYMVEYDSELHVKRVSDPFSFTGADVEFTTCIYREEYDIKILVSIHDQLLYEFCLDSDIIEGILGKTLHKTAHADNLYEQFARDAAICDNYYGVDGFRTFLEAK